MKSLGKRRINADVAYWQSLQMDSVLWLNLQNNYELDLAKKSVKKYNSLLCNRPMGNGKILHSIESFTRSLMF
jgi:plasmid maintenance system antidote protein VapI